MTKLKFARQFAGPALAVVLFIGVAPAGLTAAEVTSIWGTAPQAETAPRADQPLDQTSNPRGAETAVPQAAVMTAPAGVQAHGTK